VADATPVAMRHFNFQSIKNKRTLPPMLIGTTQPDIIIGTTTWLSTKIGSQEMFQPEVIVKRMLTVAFLFLQKLNSNSTKYLLGKTQT
jgi:hypothetical protein